MKRLLTMILLTMLMFANVVFACNVEGNEWAFDETNSLTENTTEYIRQLNENELKDYQYAVYVTDTLKGMTMDEYKNSLFNEYGIGTQEKNSGILFVLATEDREYGLEFGDGMSGELERQLRKDFVSEIALSELKSGDWDGAIYKVSNHILNLVIETENADKADPGDKIAIDSLGPGGTSTGAGTNSPSNGRSLIINLISWLVAIIISATVVGAPFVFFSADNSFFRSNEFKQYLSKYSLNKKEVKEDIKKHRGRYYTLNERSLYNHLIDKVSERLRKDNVFINSGTLLSIFSFDDFQHQENTTIDKLSKKLQRSHEESIRKEKELKRRTNEWIDEIIQKNDNKYSDDIVNQVYRQINSWNIKKENFEKVFNTQYRMIEIEHKVKDLFPELTTNERRDILNNVNKTQEYSNYVNGITNAFTPTHDRTNQSPYYYQDNIVNTGVPNYQNMWFWLWLYGVNSNKMYQKSQVEQAERRKQQAAARRRQNNASNNSTSFGSSFGGGFSGKF